MTAAGHGSAPGTTVEADEVDVFAPAASHQGYLRCHDCALVCREVALPAGQIAACPRCDADLHPRKPASLQRSWAWLIAAAIIYIPANTLPVSIITWFGETKGDTIISGIWGLADSGDIPVAGILFACSIMVPALKIIVLAWLLLAVQFKSVWRPRDRTRLYRFIEVIGRWSMLDIFVIGILASLAQLGAIATIHAGAGAISFCIVVVLTMMAASSFDPRLAWDVIEEQSP